MVCRGLYQRAHHPAGLSVRHSGGGAIHGVHLRSTGARYGVRALSGYLASTFTDRRQSCNIDWYRVSRARLLVDDPPCSNRVVVGVVVVVGTRYLGRERTLLVMRRGMDYIGSTGVGSSTSVYSVMQRVHCIDTPDVIRGDCRVLRLRMPGFTSGFDLATGCNRIAKAGLGRRLTHVMPGQV